MQGTGARYANCVDVEESSQAEGTFEGAVGYARNNEHHRNPHYENIYESIDQYVASTAPVPADNNIRQNLNNNNNRNPIQSVPCAYRNELYDRTSGYDIPRQMLRSHPPNTCAMARRANLNLDMKQNRARYVNTMNRAHRQRSFDDTESYHYAYNNNNFRYENIYEQIREEPIYRNVGVATREDGSQVYGRLDVIGHGIGRIERHLSSSCGNIDHYNLGGHYAILGHSHLGTVGHIRLNTANAPNNARETGGKGLNLFSCLGRENSQSMSNICPGPPNQNISAANVPNAESAPSTSAANDNARMKNTGAIPKMKNKDDNNAYSPFPIHSSTLNRIPKSSLQWLLVNKWLPLWVGNGPDCNVVDFNFMFSRNCEGCLPNNEYHPSGELFTNSNYSRNHYPQPDDNLSAQRSARFMSRIRENDRRITQHDNLYYDRPRNNRFANHTLPERRQHQCHGGCTRQHIQNRLPNDPFYRWELNSENNSFRPAVRRITDGTYPPNRNQTINASSNNNNNNNNQNINNRVIHVEINRPTTTERKSPTQQRSQTNQTNEIAGPSTSKCHQHLLPAQNQTENALSSSTESTSATFDIKISSSDANNCRYSENTEDDQVSSGSLSQTENTDFENSNESDEIDDNDDNDLTENGIDSIIRNDVIDENSATENVSSNPASEQN